MCVGLRVMACMWRTEGNLGEPILAFHPLRLGLFCFCCAVSSRLAGLLAFRPFSYLCLPSHSGSAGVTNAYHLKTPVGRLSLKVVLPAELSFRSYYHFNSPHYKTNKQPAEKRSEVQISIYFDILHYSSQTILWPYALTVMVYCQNFCSFWNISITHLTISKYLYFISMCATGTGVPIFEMSFFLIPNSLSLTCCVSWNQIPDSGDGEDG